MSEQVLINCISNDLPQIKTITERLDFAGITFFIAPPVTSPDIQEGLVEKIKGIASARGCMLCILSNESVANSFFISNIQLMCETALAGKVLVFYQVEDLKADQDIRLFSSQALQVGKGNHPEQDITKVIRSIQQIIHPPARNIFHFLSQNLSRKVLIRWLSASLVMGVGGTILFNLLQPRGDVPVLPTPTPLIMYVPFSGQSQDAGLIVDARNVPDYLASNDLAAEAPFYFKPTIILDQQDFNNPDYDHILDGRRWRFSYMLDDVSSIAINQTNGVLQMAVAPVGERTLSLTLHSKYLFNQEQLAYLGYRFRLEEYPGRKTENSSFQFASYPMRAVAMDDLHFEVDGISQILASDQNIFLGSRWHTVEMVSQHDKHVVDIFLDGKKIRTVLFNDLQLNAWGHFAFSINISDSNDWVRVQIDEIIFGASQPLPTKLTPEEAPYRFTPDKVDLHEDFSTQAYQQFLVQGGEFISQAAGSLVFQFPPGKELAFVLLEIPGKSILEDNYYATRFRFTSPDHNIWSSWASFYIGLRNMDTKAPDRVELLMGADRWELNFRAITGRNQIINTFAYNQVAQPENWHTLEMVVSPPGASSGEYTAFIWVDGSLLGQSNLEHPEQLLEAGASLRVVIELNSGINRQDVFSGEIDDLVIGNISSEKIQE
jgi:hypothetical protein